MFLNEARLRLSETGKKFALRLYIFTLHGSISLPYCALLILSQVILYLWLYALGRVTNSYGHPFIGDPGITVSMNKPSRHSHVLRYYNQPIELYIILDHMH